MAGRNLRCGQTSIPYGRRVLVIWIECLGLRVRRKAWPHVVSIKLIEISWPENWLDCQFSNFGESWMRMRGLDPDIGEKRTSNQPMQPAQYRDRSTAKFNCKCCGNIGPCYWCLCIWGQGVSDLKNRDVDFLFLRACDFRVSHCQQDSWREGRLQVCSQELNAENRVSNKQAIAYPRLRHLRPQLLIYLITPDFI